MLEYYAPALGAMLLLSTERAHGKCAVPAFETESTTAHPGEVVPGYANAGQEARNEQIKTGRFEIQCPGRYTDNLDVSDTGEEGHRPGQYGNAVEYIGSPSVFQSGSCNIVRVHRHSSRRDKQVDIPGYQFPDCLDNSISVIGDNARVKCFCSQSLQFSPYERLKTIFN